jgi:hypothetical protein
MELLHDLAIVRLFDGDGCQPVPRQPQQARICESAADQAAAQSIFHHRFHKPRRIGAELAHDPEVIRLLDAHRLQAVFR